MKVFRFQVDTPFARKHNEMLRDTRRLQLSAIVMGLVLVGIGAVAYFLANGQAWGWITLGVFAIMAVISWIIAVVVPSKVGTAQELYDTYPLIPAMIVEVNPRDMVIMGLVNTNVDPALPPRWGAALRTVTDIPGVKRVVGQRLPAVAVSGQRTLRDKEHWTQISPMPIAWGTPDSDVVKKAKSAIPGEQWDLLSKASRRFKDVLETPYNLLVLP